MPDIQGFIQQYAPVAASVSQKIGVAPDVLLGQWGLETGWGKSVIPGTNNLGNIKGPGVAATDNQTGSNDQYRAYANPQAFGNDFANLISSNYKGAVGAGSDASAYGKALKAGGYAEDSAYANKLAGAVGMVRKFGDAIASAISGTANAAEISPQQMGAPVISATGQQIMPQAKPQPALASPQPTSTGDPLLDMAQAVQGSGTSNPAPGAAPNSTASPAGSDTDPDGGLNVQVSGPPRDPLLEMAQQVQDAKDSPRTADQPAAPIAGASWPGGEIGRQLGLTARAAGHGIADTVDLVGAPLNATINTLFGAHLHNPGDAIRAGVDAVTPAPQNTLERVVNAGASSMAGAGIGSGAAGAVARIADNPLTQAIAAQMAAHTGAQLAGGAGAGAASQGAQAAGAGPLVQMGAGLLGGLAGGAAGAGVAAGANRLAGAVQSAVKPAAVADRIEPTVGAQASPQSVAPEAQAPNTSTQGATLRGVGAAEANQNPYAGQLTGEETARGGSSAFPQVKVAKNAGDVPPDEQAVRAKIANEILGPDNDAVRTGVVTGNEDMLRSEHTLSRSSDNTPEQIALRNQIAREQQALSNYSQQRIDATGASPNLTNNEQRGQVINDAVHGEGGLNEWFQQAKQQIYDRARAESGDNPIHTSHVDALLSDPQFIAEAERGGNSRVVSGITQLMDLARNTGFRDPITGEVTSPGSVAAWDAVRKSNNADWNEGNARTIGAINRAIDQDIASAAGSDAYKLGDAIHQAQQTIMGARGFKQIFGDADANGVKSGAAVEQIPSRLNNMPIDQWRHIYNTFDDLSKGRVAGAPDGAPPIPQELQQAAQAAKNEMSGALAREVYEQGAGKAGVWNQNSVNKTLNSVVGQKILQTFPPDEIEKFHTLNYGGQIMPGVHSYEGAGLQTQRLNKASLAEKHAGKIGASLGGGLGGAISGGAAASAGAGAGAWAGNKLAAGLASKRLEGEANQLIEAMRMNSKRGR